MRGGCASTPRSADVWSTAAPLVTPPGSTCLDCETALHRSTTISTTSHRRRGLLARLLRPRVPQGGPQSRATSSHRRCKRDALHVASFADGDTHLAEPAPHAHLVTAHCDGRQFRPLAVLHGEPPDQEQVCPTCHLDQPVVHSTAPTAVTEYQGVAVAAPALVAVARQDFVRTTRSISSYAANKTIVDESAARAAATEVTAE